MSSEEADITQASRQHPQLPHAHLDNVQLGQQVAVGQGHFIAIKKFTCGELDVFHAVLINFIGERGVQVLIQLLQGFQETPLQRWGKRTKWVL